MCAAKTKIPAGQRGAFPEENGGVLEIRLKNQCVSSLRPRKAPQKQVAFQKFGVSSRRNSRLFEYEAVVPSNRTSSEEAEQYGHSHVRFFLLSLSHDVNCSLIWQAPKEELASATNNESARQFTTSSLGLSAHQKQLFKQRKRSCIEVDF